MTSHFNVGSWQHVLNFTERPKKGLTSGSDSVFEVFFTLIAFKILQYFQLGIATENTQKNVRFSKEMAEKSFHCRSYFSFIYYFIIKRKK